MLKRFSISQSVCLVALSSLLGLSACQEHQVAKEPSTKQATSPSEPTVGVITAHASTIPIETTLNARLEPFREAQVRARASGIVQKKMFSEGSYVHAGQVLFQIDNTPYMAAMNSAQANLAIAQANLDKANIELKRYQALIAEHAVSQQDFETASTQQKLAAAQLRSALSNVQSAKVNLDHTRVTAPISGYVDQAMVTEGALVGSDGPTLLTTIRQIDRLYAKFTQSAEQIQSIRQLIRQGKLENTSNQVEVSIFLNNGTPYSHKGKLLFSGLSVDKETGQIAFKAEIPNPEQILLPGMFVSIKLPVAQSGQSFLLPQQAVTLQGDHGLVTVVTAEHTLIKKSVTLSGQQNNQWIVTQGLEEGDQVVVSGLDAVQLMGAQKVKTETWQNPLNALPNKPSNTNHQ